MNSSVTGVEEITPEQFSLSLTTSLRLFITQMHDHGFGLIGPHQVHHSNPSLSDVVNDSEDCSGVISSGSVTEVSPDIESLFSVNFIK